MANKKTCETCRHLGEGEPAHCRRYPPQVADILNSTFPLVNPTNHYCGEYERTLKRRTKPKAQ